jgi:hypothetical protein
MSTITQPGRSVQPKSRPLTASLDLLIRDDVYSLTSISPGEDGSRAWRLEKRGDGDAVYDVIRTHSGLVECSCPSYIATHAGTSSTCKHGQALVIVGLLEAPAAVAQPDPRDAYNDAREKLAALEQAEQVVRSEGEMPSPPVKSIHPTTYDPQWQAALAAVAKGNAIWIDHRHLHASEPLPPRMTVATTDSPRRPIAFELDKLSSPRMTVATTDSPRAEPRLVDDDGTLLPTFAEIDQEHKAAHLARVRELMEGNRFLPAVRQVEAAPCCEPAEPSPCTACSTHTFPEDLSGEDWRDDERYEIGPETDPFDGWIRRQADAYAKIKTPRAAWLARQISRLAERARFLDADSPEAFDDRLDAHLDAVHVEAEARQAARC